MFNSIALLPSHPKQNSRANLVEQLMERNRENTAYQVANILRATDVDAFKRHQENRIRAINKTISDSPYSGIKVYKKRFR